MFSWLFECDHFWFGFKGNSVNIEFSNDFDVSFKIVPKFCLKCNSVKWEQVDAKLASASIAKFIRK